MKSSYAKFWWKVTIAICPSPERGSNRSWLNRSLSISSLSASPSTMETARVAALHVLPVPGGPKSIRLNGGIGSALRLCGDAGSSALLVEGSTFVRLESIDGSS